MPTDPSPYRGRIILLDLNFTLVANSRELGFPSGRSLHREEYRSDLVEAIRAEDVILITVRPARLKEATLQRIAEKLGWQPAEAWFNDLGYRAPEFKRHALLHHVMPRHGRDADRYFAIESNVATRNMYAGFGIRATTVQVLLGDR